MVFAIHHGAPMSKHMRKGKLGFTAMLVASILGTLALCSCEAHGSEDDSAAGRTDAPEIVLIPGDIISSTASPSEAIQTVQKQKTMGAGFIKLVNADRAGTLAILDEAKNQGLHVAGHLPVSISAVDASDAGWRAVGFAKTQISSTSTRRHGSCGKA